jgi:hypothetical protein
MEQEGFGRVFEEEDNADQSKLVQRNTRRTKTNTSPSTLHLYTTSIRTNQHFPIFNI